MAREFTLPAFEPAPVETSSVAPLHVGMPMVYDEACGRTRSDKIYYDD